MFGFVCILKKHILTLSFVDLTRLDWWVLLEQFRLFGQSDGVQVNDGDNQRLLLRLLLILQLNPGLDGAKVVANVRH
jgi:hypothetical protein